MRIVMELHKGVLDMLEHSCVKVDVTEQKGVRT